MFIYLLLAEVLNFGVVEVHEGVLKPSDPSGKPFESKFNQEMRKKTIEIDCFHLWKLVAQLTKVGFVDFSQGEDLEDRFQKIQVVIYTNCIHKNLVKIAIYYSPPPPVSGLSKRISLPSPHLTMLNLPSKGSPMIVSCLNSG